MALYKISLLLYKDLNSFVPGTDWQEFSHQIICTPRKTTFEIFRIVTTKLAATSWQINFLAQTTYFSLIFKTYPICPINIR
jgi:hypothetical protein